MSDAATGSGQLRTPVVRLTKSQYAHLVRDIESKLKKHLSVKGGGGFAAPETLDGIIHHPLSQVQFYVHGSGLEGGGFFSSIGDAAKHVWGLLKSSGAVDAAKKAGSDAIKTAGTQAINDAANAAAKMAKDKTGVDISGATQALATQAHGALGDAVAAGNKAVDGIGSGMRQAGAGMYQAGHFDGGGLYQSGAGIASSRYGTPGIPRNAHLVGHNSHLVAHSQTQARGGM